MKKNTTKFLQDENIDNKINEAIDTIKREFDAELQGLSKDTTDTRSTKELEKKYLGKEAKLNGILANISSLPKEYRKEAGIESNKLKKYILEKLGSLNSSSTGDSQVVGAKGAGGKKGVGEYDEIDVGLPGKRRRLGRYHPHTLVMREMNEIFKQLGFSVYAGPEIETDKYVFEKLNLPKNHPARSLQDTLIIEDPEIILRSHTSSVEARAMENEKLPLRIVVPGRTFRYEDLNQTNHFAFYQYEGLAVGENISLADLKGTFESFAKSFFGEETEIRIRAKYYPQVEPGCGLDMKCKFCNGEGCPVCKYRGWVEVSGGGVVHPNMLKSCGIDPKKYSGIAWGMGFDRIVMQKYEINDIRKLYDGTLY